VAQVSGAVRDEQTRASIRDALTATFGAENFKGDVAVDPGRASAPWLAKLGDALKAVRVPGLKAAFDGASIQLEGAIPSMGRQQVAALLGSIYGDAVTVAGPGAKPAPAAASPATPSIEERAAAANAKAEAALGALTSGSGAKEVASALNLSVINFASSSAETPESVTALLNDAARLFKTLPEGTEIEIAGYTDNTGDPDANLVLSRQRAESVRAALVKAGAPEAMLTAKGYGAADPVDSNDTEEGRFHNRRIEYHVLTAP